jgi:hypothetical protein
MKMLLIITSLTIATPAISGPLCDATYGPDECARRRARVIQNPIGAITGVLSGAARGYQASGGYDVAPRPSMACQISQWRTDVWGRPVLECN